MILSRDQINRYLRHIIIPEISGPGQKKLLESKVFIFATNVKEATSLIYYLAASGIGFIYCHLKDSTGFDDLLNNVQDLNEDIVLELNDYKEAVSYNNYITNKNVLIRVLISNYDDLTDSLINFKKEESYPCLIPTIVAINSGWKGYLQTIDNISDFEYLFSNSFYTKLCNIKTSQKIQESSFISSCFLGTLTTIECIKLCLNLGTVLSKPLSFDLLSMKFSIIEHVNIKSTILDFSNNFYSYNPLPLNATKISVTKKLSECKVLVIGTGGLGCPVIYALASLGIGTIGIVDYDTVEISNLNRQILHSKSKIGMLKIESAKLFINSFAPLINIVTYNTDINAKNALDIIKNYDIVVDAVDNFPSRYLINDSCFFANKPLVDAAAVRFGGLIMTILPNKGPCYRCTFPAISDKNSTMSCSEAGVLGPVPGVMGFLQAAEVIKLLLSKGNTLCNRIIYYDALDCDFYTINTEKSLNCDLCGNNPKITIPIK